MWDISLTQITEQNVNQHYEKMHVVRPLQNIWNILWSNVSALPFMPESSSIYIRNHVSRTNYRAKSNQIYIWYVCGKL